MIDRIRHNYSSLIHCLRAFHILFFAYLLVHCYCYNHYKTKNCHHYHYYHITLLLNTLLQILSYPSVVELTTQLLILENILWLPLCRINSCETLYLWVSRCRHTHGFNEGRRASLKLVACGEEVCSAYHAASGSSWPMITHKYRGLQPFSRVEYSTQIYWIDTTGAKEYSQVLAAELSIQPHLET